MYTSRIKLPSCLASLIMFFYISGGAQTSYLKGSLVANQLDNPSSIANLDTSLEWSSWSETGVIGYALEYQHPIAENFSIKPRIGLSSFRLRYLREEEDNFFTSRRYSNRYFNLAFITSYQFKENHRGLQIGAGPALYFLNKHTAFQSNRNSRDFIESTIRDRFNDLPLYLQFEINYSFKLFNALGAQWGMEIGMTPSLKLNTGFLSVGDSAFTWRGFRLGGIVWLNRDTE